MTFLQFLGYYLASMFIYEGLILTLAFFIRRKNKKKLTNDLQNIKLMTVEEFLSELQKQEDKKTWN